MYIHTAAHPLVLCTMYYTIKLYDIFFDDTTGASSALVASPCCTPVLASILGFIASSQDPALGLVLLLTYSAGYTTPLMAAGTASGVLSRLMSAKGLNWITPASGALLISYGTYNGLSAIFGPA